MGINLTPAQQSTLEPNINLLVEAGAGSGKTTVFIQRFITLLYNNPDITADRILGITYTNLAASELLLKLRTVVLNDQHPALSDTDFKERLLSQLHTVPFMTIHGLCSTICKQFPREAEVDPDVAICDTLQSSLLMDEAISDTLSDLSSKKDKTLRALLRVYSPSQLAALSKQLLTQRMVTTPHAKHYLTTTISEHLPDEEELTPTTHTAYIRLQHLCEFFLKCSTHYKRLKQQNGMMDYDDLIINAMSVMEYPHCLAQLQDTYRFIMVDEFQDTDQYQWTLIQRLCDSFSPFKTDKLFLVGDVKQSIYSFRHADPEIFMSVFNTFKSSPQLGKVIHMADNFRSNSVILNFVNTLFSSLFKTSTLSIPYTPLTAFHNNDSSISLGLLEPYTSFKEEADFIARWILKLVQTTDIVPADIAILTRRKTIFPVLKEALAQVNIPVSVDIQINFFRRDHSLDIIHIVELFISPYSPLALFALLKSPLIGLSEEELFLLQHNYKTTYPEKTPSLFEQFKTYNLSADHNHKRTVILEAVHNTKKLTVSESLTQFLNALSHDSCYSDTDCDDIAILIDLIEEWEVSFNYNRHDLLHHLFHSIESNAVPTTKQTQTEGVRLLTIHASKGLEFPVVIIPELHQKFNSSKQSSLLITKDGLGLSCSDLDGPNQYRVHLLTQHEKSTIDEEKRLFYVACTRAKSHLLLTGNPDAKKNESYLNFLNDITLEPNPQHHRYTNINDISPEKNYSPKQKETEASPAIETQSNIFKNTSSISKGKIALSVSQIEAFIRCPKHYWLNTLFQAFNTQNQSQTSLEQGILTHSLIDKINATPNTPIETLIETILTEHNKKNDVDLHTFLKAQATHYISSSIFKDVKTHIWLSEKSFSFTHFDMIIEGRFDLVLFEGNTVHVIDFKTDNPNTKATHKTQLLIYMLALSQLYPTYTIKASLYFTQSNRLSTLKWNDNDIQTFSSTLKTITKALYEKEFTAPNITTCNQCPLYTIDKTCPTKPIQNP